VRMATESDVDISGAHPYWAYPFSDIAVVHNGQLTNYHMWRRRLERKGHRFQSECDSEIIAVYLAQKMDDGLSLETAMKQSLDELDGVFTYLVVTADSLGVAKDEMAAKPLVLYESPELVALASEEVARGRRRQERRLADRCGAARRRCRGARRRGRPLRHRPEGRHDHRRRQRGHDDRVHAAARPPDHLRQRGRRPGRLDVRRRDLR